MRIKNKIIHKKFIFQSKQNQTESIAISPSFKVSESTSVLKFSHSFLRSEAFLTKWKANTWQKTITTATMAERVGASLHAMLAYGYYDSSSVRPTMMFIVCTTWPIKK